MCYAGYNAGPASKQSVMSRKPWTLIRGQQYFLSSSVSGMCILQDPKGPCPSSLFCLNSLVLRGFAHTAFLPWLPFLALLTYLAPFLLWKLFRTHSREEVTTLSLILPVLLILALMMLCCTVSHPLPFSVHSVADTKLNLDIQYSWAFFQKARAFFIQILEARKTVFCFFFHTSWCGAS